jgi:hypothetical protein
MYSVGVSSVCVIYSMCVCVCVMNVCDTISNESV